MKNLCDPRIIKNVVLFGLIGTLPVRIDSTSSWNSETKLKLYGVSGQYAYVSRGCEGQIVDKQGIPFTEFGGSLDYKPSPDLRIGLHASMISTKAIEPDSNGEIDHLINVKHYCFNPFFNSETDYWAVGMGFFFMRSQFPLSTSLTEDAFEFRIAMSVYLRYGNPELLYVDGAFFQKSPLMSSAPLCVGVGSDAIPYVGWWVGASSVTPYDTPGLIYEITIKPHENISLDFFARRGRSEGIGENAIGVGLSYRFGTNK